MKINEVRELSTSELKEKLYSLKELLEKTSQELISFSENVN